MAKCPIETGRNAPGMHGEKRTKLSDYGRQFREKQRLKRFYGLQDAQLRLFYQKAAQRRGITGETLLQMLEMRLDNIVYRLGFMRSRRAARQFVLHKHVRVNGKRADIPSMILKVGDQIDVKENEKSRALAKKSLEATEGGTISPWLSLDRAKFHAVILHLPTKEEIAPLVDEQLVVELCSKG
jgi:small subunit ribosomal protein S4